MDLKAFIENTSRRETSSGDRLGLYMADEAVVLDTKTNGYVHPDGTPCRAQSVLSCPFFRRDKMELERTDDLGSATPSYDRKIRELEALYNSPGFKAIPGMENVSLERLKNAFSDFLCDLEQYEAGDEEVKWHNTQDRRDEIYEKNKAREYATINAETGIEREDCKGFGVTFHTTLSDAEMTPEEYDEKVSELVYLGGADTWNVGIFQGGGEISIDCKEGGRAIAMMLHWNQNSIYNYNSGITIYNLTYDEKENPGLERGYKRIDS